MPVRPPAEPHPGLTAARAARAAGPGPDLHALRTAYLELLKLSLCDLAGAGTESVGRTEDDLVASRELTGDQLRLRAAGMDWPLHGLTMVGLRRLDDLQACIESVVEDAVGGDLIEAGAWRGGASILMRAVLDTLGADERTVWVADSFRGFPAQADPAEDRWAAIDYLQVGLEEVRDNFARVGLEHGVRFVPGFFEDTLPKLREQRWSIVRLDGDTYQATSVALESLYPQLSVGGYVVIDDYGALKQCRRAVDEFRARNAIDEPLEEVDWTCVRWQRERSAPIRAGAPRPASEGDRARPVERPRDIRVPTFRELGLERELAELRQRLAAAESELNDRRRSWFRRRPAS